MNGGAWWAAVHGVSKSQTLLSDFTFTSHFHALEKEIETHSSVLAWWIPGTGEPGGLPSMGSHGVRHDWSDLAAATCLWKGFPGGSVVKNLPAMQETHSPWVRKIPWKRKWQPTPEFWLKNFMDRGGWWATVHGVTESDATEHLWTCLWKIVTIKRIIASTSISPGCSHWPSAVPPSCSSPSTSAYAGLMIHQFSYPGYILKMDLHSVSSFFLDSFTQ